MTTTLSSIPANSAALEALAAQFAPQGASPASFADTAVAARIVAAGEPSVNLQTAPVQAIAQVARTAPAPKSTPVATPAPTATSTLSASEHFRQLLEASFRLAPNSQVLRQVVEGTYVGNGLVEVQGLKFNVPLIASERKHNEPARGTTAPVLLMNRHLANGDVDPMAEEDSTFAASFAMAADWNNIIESQKAGKFVEGVLFFKLMRKGGVFAGYKVRVGSLTGILPARAFRGIADPQSMAFSTISLEIVKTDLNENRLEFGLKAIVEARRERMEAVTTGELLTGKVERVLDCGVLVNIGNGACGLVHNSELLRGPKPTIGQDFHVIVTAKDVERGRVSLSQRLGARRAFVRDFAVGDEFTGTVASVKPYGVFVSVAPGVAGLVHASRIPGYSEDSAQQSLPSPLRVKLVKMDDLGERIDFALVTE